MQNDSLQGLSGKAGNLLYRHGLTTRTKIAEAGPAEWMKIPGFGVKSAEEVRRWLGKDAPRKRQTK